jgi:hypothetical protein
VPWWKTLSYHPLATRAVVPRDRIIYDRRRLQPITARMMGRPVDESGGTTRIDCENTGGYNVRPGIHAYEYCPFCGHPVIEGEDHELTLSIED